MTVHELCLQWAIINGESRHVADFAHLKPNQHPEAFCPICNRPVTMRLGQVRVFHVAHSLGDVCIATQPETVGHVLFVEKYFISYQT